MESTRRAFPFYADYERGECLVIVFIYLFIFQTFLFTFIHQGLDPDRFRDETRGRRETYMCLAALFADS